MNNEEKVLVSGKLITEKTIYPQIISVLDSFNRIVGKGLAYIAATVLAALMFLTFADVLLRYVFTRPLAWSYELTRLFLLIIIFFGLAYVGLKKSNIRISVVTDRLSVGTQAILNLITGIMSLILFVFFTWQGIVQAMILFESKQVFSNLQFPVYAALIMLSLGCFAFCIVLLRDSLINFAEYSKKVGRQAWIWLAVGIVISFMLCFMPFWYPLAGIGLSSPQWSILGIIIFFLLMFLGMPLAPGMAMVGFIGVGSLIGLDAGFNLIGTTPASTGMRYTFSVVPLFVLMGAFAFQAGIITDLYFSISKWVGRLPGGLAIASLAGCAGFAAVCGSSVASCAAMSTICYPELQRYKYNPGLAAGCIAAGGTLGIMIPPSLDFIVYGVLTMTSIGALFIAGILPGILMMFLFMGTAFLLCRRNLVLGPPVPGTYSLKEKVSGLSSIWPVLLLFLLVIGGIYMGVFTPTEAGGIGAFGAFALAMGKGKLKWSNFLGGLMSTVETTSMILIILTGAMILGYFLTLTKVPLTLANLLAAIPLNRWFVIAIVMVVYLALGCVMDAFAIMIITVPIVFPAIMTLGFNPIWYGVLMITTVELGLITPPFGMGIFVVAGITKLPMDTVFRGVMPFIIADLTAVALIIGLPSIALFLPSLMKQ